MKWEYLVIFLDPDQQRDLNKRGDNGWECFQLLVDKEDPTEVTAYFKRPLRSKSEDEIMKHFDEGRSSLV